MAARRSKSRGKGKGARSRRHQQGAELPALEESTQTGPGTIVGHYGVAVEVRFEDGGRRLVRSKRNAGHVVGDRVEVSEDGLARQDRDTELHRRNLHGQIQVVAANLDVLGIVVSTRPPPPSGFIDCAIVAARCSGIEPLLILNKSDLPGTVEIEERLRRHYSGGLRLFVTSAEDGSGLEELARFLAGDAEGDAHQGAFIGTTGVGKSSLLNALCPGAHIEVKEIDERSGHGRHTTTTSTLHKLPGGGELIDTPGFRDFRPADLSPVDLAYHFLGFEAALEERCRFGDCLHRVEPNCRVREAVEAGDIGEARYAQYLAILEELQDIAERARY